MRIIMTKEQSSETEPTTPTTSTNNSALRVTGFKVKQVEPKNDSLESWCNKVVDINEQKEFQNLDPPRIISLRKNIEHSHSEIAIEASVDGNTDKRTGAEYQRTLQHGNERYENLLLSDYKESHRSKANTSFSNLERRRDIDWILSKTPLSN